MAAPVRELSSEKAQRIVDAMRTSVAQRGAAGSTFDQVARAAGVSRGLLHYYFGTKERLLVEVCRRDCDIRMAILDETFAAAGSAEQLVDGLVVSLHDLLIEDPGFIALTFELFTVSRHNEEMAAELRELFGRVREHVALRLAELRDAGTISLTAEPDAIATVLFALADGLALRMLVDPEHDWATTVAAGVVAVRQLVV